MNPLLVAAHSAEDTEIDDLLDVDSILQSPDVHLYRSHDRQRYIEGYYTYEDYSGKTGWLRERLHALLLPNEALVSVRISVHDDSDIAAQSLAKICSGSRWGYVYPGRIVRGTHEGGAYCYSYARSWYVSRWLPESCDPFDNYHMYAAAQTGNMVILLEEITWSSHALHIQDAIDRTGAALRR